MFVNKGLWSWLLQRLTALFLIVGLVVHFFVLHFMIERPVTMEKVAARLNHPAWITFDSILLALCLYHALNGLNSIFLDLKPGKVFQRVVFYAFWIVGVLTAAIGIVNLIPFTRV